MQKYKHILFVTDELELTTTITKELWQYNTNWCIVSTDNIYTYDVKTFLNRDDYKLMVITNSKKIIERKVNEFVNFCKKYNILPIFITTTETYDKSLSHIMYSNIEELFDDSFEYIHNEKDPNCYTVMLNMLREYLW